MTDHDREQRGEEARAQKQQTISPLLWGGFGLVVILAFIGFLFMGGQHGSAPHAIVSPSQAPATRLP